MPTMQMIVPVDMTGEDAKIQVSREQLAMMTKVVNAWVRDGNKVENLVMFKDGDDWVVWGAEIRMNSEEISEEARKVADEAQRMFRDEVRMALTVTGKEWYSLRVSESVQVGGVG